MSLPDIKQVEKIVKLAAIEELMPGFGDNEYTCKDDGSVVTRSDIAMQARLNREFRQHWPEYELLGEEMSLQDQQSVIASGKGYWCIDPMDGSNNYTGGVPLFAVSVALVIDGIAELGLIYDPVRDELFSAIRHGGAQLNGVALVAPVNAQQRNRVIAEIEMKRLPPDLLTRFVTEGVPGSYRNTGSSAIDWCWLAAGRFNIFLHGGQQYWDYAAGYLIFTEVGGYCVSLDDKPVFSGDLEVRSVLASLDKDLFEEWYRWIGIPVA